MKVSLSGNNSLLLKRRLDELTEAFVNQHGELALEKIDSTESNLNSVLEAIGSLPFLASKKMVILREPSKNKAVAEDIEKVIALTGETTDLIIYDPAPDKRSSYFKTLQKQTQLEQFNDLDVPGLANWLLDEAKKQGGEISRGDAAYLIDRVGQNQMLLANELLKLLAYDFKISRKNIDLLTEPAPQSKVFDLLDAAFGNNKKRALQLYDEQRAQQVEPQAILAMIAWQLQQMTVVFLAKDKSADQISRDTGMKSYPLNKASTLVKRIGTSNFKKMIDDIVAIDYKSKSQTLDLDEALKTYIISL
jgi:DNA polymerase-3 subunit delta